MEKRRIEYDEYANTIIKALPSGILLTTKAEGRINSMVIGWGTIGINWGKPVFAAYVRSRQSGCMKKTSPRVSIRRISAVKTPARTGTRM